MEIGEIDRIKLPCRMLVTRNDGQVTSGHILLEIVVVELSPSGDYMKYKMTGGNSDSWTVISTFKLVEILNNK